MEHSEILERVSGIMVETNPELGLASVAPEATLGTLGLDSIKLVELGVRLEQAFGDEVVLDDWVDQEKAREGDAFTVGSLVAFIARAKAGPR